MIKKKQHKRKKNNIIKYFFFSIVVLYVILQLISIASSSTNETEIVEYGDIKVVHNLDCYIIRSEELIRSNKEGSIKYLAQQGQKVEKGYKIVEIANDIVDEATRKKLEVIQQRIDSLNIDENNLFQNDVDKLEKDIELAVMEIKESKEKQDLLKLEKMAKDLKNKLEKKRIIAGDKSFAGKNLESLKTEKEQLEQRINNTVMGMTSPEAGIISYYIDGYENILKTRNIETLELEELKKIKSKIEDLRVDKVIYNQPLFKIIDSHVWYIVTWINDDLLEYYKAGKNVTFKFTHGDVNGSIYKLIEGEKESLVIFQLNEYVDDFLKLRNVNIDVVAIHYEGLKIHKDSIIEKDGIEGVFVLDINRSAVFKPVKVIGYDKDYAVVKDNVFYEKVEDETKTIETINLYDEVVRNASKVKEGQLVI